MTAPIPGIEALEAAAQAAGQRIADRREGATDRRLWSGAGAIALTLHGAALAAVLVWSREASPLVPDPVVLVELPAEAAPAPVPDSVAQPTVQPQVQPAVSQAVRPPLPLDIPHVKAPLPSDPVTLPSPAPAQPQRNSAAPSVPQPAAAPPITNPLAGNGSNASPAASNDPRARKEQADWYALVAAHLNRRKSYPSEAKQARQQGVVTVRFTAARDGSVSAVSIKKSSGHEVLDRATLDLVQRVAPLPRMPASMPQGSVTIALPIDYSLRTS